MIAERAVIGKYEEQRGAPQQKFNAIVGPDSTESFSMGNRFINAIEHRDGTYRRLIAEEAEVKFWGLSVVFRRLLVELDGTRNSPSV